MQGHQQQVYELARQYMMERGQKYNEAVLFYAALHHNCVKLIDKKLLHAQLQSIMSKRHIAVVLNLANLYTETFPDWQDHQIALRYGCRKEEKKD